MIWKMRLDRGAVDMGNADLMSGETGRMQNNESGTIGHDIRFWRRDHDERERTVARSGYPSLIGEPLTGIGANGAIGHDEAFSCLFDFQIIDLRGVSAPVLVAHEKGDCPQRFDACEGHVAQLAVLEL